VPGLGIHIGVADAVASHLKGLKSWPYRTTDSGPNAILPADLAAIASKHKNYFALGAVGPDLFFFLPDFRNGLASPLIGVMHFLDQLYEALDSWILEDWERYFGPGSENTTEAISRLTGDLSTVVQDVMGKLSSLLINALLDLAASAHDWWGLFSLGLNKGFDNRDFFWSDMLHYRRTSLFAHRLWTAADDFATSGEDDAALWSERLKAYALGYMTHVATDTTGHGFVNQKCGGPFRTHWQRHHLIENHMDCKTYDDDHGMDANYSMFTECALHYRIAFADDGGDARDRPPYPAGNNSIRALYVRRRQLDLDSKMPDRVAQLLFDAMDATYQTTAQKDLNDFTRTTPQIIPGDGRPSPTTVQETYLTLFRFLKLSTLDGFNHEKPMPPQVFPNLDFPQLTDPHDDEPGEGDEDMSFWDVVLAILRFILWIGAVAVWLATILPAIVADLGTYGPRLLAYYTIELPLYMLLKAERAVLVMSAYLHPMQDEIDQGLVQIGNNNHGNFLQLLSQVDDVLPTGLTVGDPTAEPASDPLFPHQAKFEEEGLLNRIIQKSNEEYHHPWDYPETPLELCHTLSGPFMSGDLPHLLLEDNTPANVQLILRYAAAATPFDTDTISFTAQLAQKTPHMGDPVNFASFLIWQLARPEIEEGDVTNWNLDADRGYAYKCWDWNRHMEDPANNLLKDADGHMFVAPCTPPSQADKDDYRPDLPLKVHYVDGKDPGCAGDEPCASGRRPRSPSGGLKAGLEARGPQRSRGRRRPRR
jgi:hypothetical protein